MEWSESLRQELLAPFPEGELEFLPRAVSQREGKQPTALGLPYIHSRAVQNRLDRVVGPGNWAFEWDLVPSGLPKTVWVRGRLTVLGTTQCEAGEASSEDELLKSAVSDALKRCAVHFGIGRYLYYLPKSWFPYDPNRKSWAGEPRVAPEALREALALCGWTGDAPAAPAAPRAPKPQPPAPDVTARVEAAVDGALARGSGPGAAVVMDRRGAPPANGNGDSACVRCGVVLSAGQVSVVRAKKLAQECPKCRAGAPQ